MGKRFLCQFKLLQGLLGVLFPSRRVIGAFGKAVRTIKLSCRPLGLRRFSLSAPKAMATMRVYHARRPCPDPEQHICQRQPAKH